MFMKKTAAAISLSLVMVSAPLISAAQQGVTATVFNKRFIPTIKPMMSYDQLVKVIGAPGVKVAADKGGTVSYRWNGGKKSVLNVRVAAGKVLDASMLAPNSHTYIIGKNGAVSERDN